MSRAPIALFVYRRLQHLQQTIASLQADPLARESELFVFSDAAKQPQHAADVAEVRSYVATISGFAAVHVVNRADNFGLARSIVSGADQLCTSHGRVIVVEDDLIVSPMFLSYMNGALDRYRDDERVMAVSDLVVTKPGGLSVSECLAKGRPMLLVSPIPGQEERNADYLLEAGAAIKAVDAATLEFKLGRLMADRARLRAMGEAAHRIARPNAAAEVVALISAAS